MRDDQLNEVKPVNYLSIQLGMRRERGEGEGRRERGGGRDERRGRRERREGEEGKKRWGGYTLIYLAAYAMVPL